MALGADLGADFGADLGAALGAALGSALGAASGAASGAALAPDFSCFCSRRFNQLDGCGGMRGKQESPRSDGLKKHVALYRYGGSEQPVQTLTCHKAQMRDDYIHSYGTCVPQLYAHICFQIKRSVAYIQSRSPLIQ